jgi:ketosteroid isomerase-like protein
MDEPLEVSQADAEIADGRAAFADALRQGDAKAAGSVYAQAARLVAPSADLIEGREAIEAFWQAGLDAGVVDVALEAMTVERRGRMAFELGRYALQLRLGAGREVIDRGTYVVVLEQQNGGSWQRAVEMFNPETPSALPAAAPSVR